MTKVEIRYDLVHALNSADCEGIGRAHGVYGIFHVRLTPEMESIKVEYDASRLNEAEVESVLTRFGIPIKRKWSI